MSNTAFDITSYIITILLTAYLTFIFGGCVVERETEKKYQTEAICYGYAEYVKANDGTIVWKWKQPNK